MPPPAEVDVAGLVRALSAASLTVATAESLTAGALSSRIADVPGASAVLRGGVVAYATEVKEGFLGVDAALLATGGAVQAGVAAQMAAGAAALLGASVGVATTGVAGPAEQDGQPVGTVFVAVADAGRSGAGRSVVEEHRFGGDRAAVRSAAADAALALLGRWVAGNEGAPPVVDR